ncbi:hypothetical protein ACWEPC_20745 [Nonomuraea sp. NPDC004297]
MASKIRLLRWEETYSDDQKERKGLVEEMWMERDLASGSDPNFKTQAGDKRADYSLDSKLQLDELAKVSLDLETGLAYRRLSDRGIHEIGLGTSGNSQVHKLGGGPYSGCTWASDPTASNGLLYCGHADAGKITYFEAPKNGTRSQAQTVDVDVANGWTAGVEDVQVYASAGGRSAYVLSGVMEGKRKFGLVDLTKSGGGGGHDTRSDKVYGTVDVSKSVERIVVSSDDRFALVAGSTCIQLIRLKDNTVIDLTQGKALMSWPALVVAGGTTYCVYALMDSGKVAFAVTDLRNPDATNTCHSKAVWVGENRPLQPLFPEPGKGKVWGFLAIQNSVVAAFEVGIPKGDIIWGRLGSSTEENMSTQTRQTFLVASW